jgi:hypothetical protein
MQQVHGVDDHRAVGRVLADGVAELLHGLDRVVQQHALPARQVRRGPVAVDPPDAGHPVLRHFGEQPLDHRGPRVVGVDQHREPGGVGGFVGHVLRSCHHDRPRGGPAPPMPGKRGAGRIRSSGRCRRCRLR